MTETRYRIIDPFLLSPRDGYKILVSSVVPRPIAWISTRGKDGSINLAPYSFFNAVGGNPPTVIFSAGNRRGSLKDTVRNIAETGEFVIHIVNRPLAEKMNITSGDYSYGVSEFEKAGLGLASSELVSVPRVAEAPIAMEAKLLKLIDVPEAGYTLVLGRIVLFHVREGLMRSNGTVDPVKLDPIARLGADEYMEAGKIFEMARPSVAG